MADEKTDRGDDIGATGDELGDTSDQVDKKTEVVVDEKLGEEAAKELGLEEGKKEPLIPKGRFDQAVKKARDEAVAATKRADDLEEKLKAQIGQVDLEKVETQIDEAEEKLEKAIADGNTELKNALRREIRQLNRQISDGNAAQHAARATAVAVEQIRYDGLVSVMEAEHPELNPDNEADYDQEVVNELTEYKQAFEAAGHSSSDALKKALRAVYREGAKPKDVEEVEDKGEAVAKQASERKETAVKKGLEAKKKQPPDGKKTGLDSDKAGVTGADSKLQPSKMSDKEWDALTDEQRSTLRGDKL